MQQEKIIAIILTVAAMLFSVVTYSYAHPTTLFAPTPKAVDYQVPGLDAGEPAPTAPPVSSVPEKPIDPTQTNKLTIPFTHTHDVDISNGKVHYYSHDAPVPVTGVRATSYGFKYHNPVMVYPVYMVYPQ